MKKYYDDIVQEVKADYSQRREARKSLELQWRLNMNYLLGNQYSEITPSGDIEDYGKQYFWQEREVYNHIAPLIDTRLAKLDNVRAKISVRPKSNDDSDINTAKMSTAILESICEENNFTHIVKEANIWSEVTGTSFYKLVWDSTKGKRIGKNKKGEVIYEGDVEIVVCTPYEIFPDSLNAPNIDACKSIIHARAYPVSQVKDIWGIDVEGEDVNVFTMENSDISGGLGYNACVPNIVFNTVKDHVIVIEKYISPTSDNPQGRLITIAGDKLLFDGDLPYINGSYENRGFPFVKQQCLGQVGCFFGMSLIERIIPIQRAFNAVKNRKHEFINRIAMGVLAVEDGSVDTDCLEEEGLSPGKILVYRQGSNPPSMLTMGRVPSDFYYEEEKLLTEFVTISGVSELMQNTRTLSSVTSGVAISRLTEQDDTRIALTANYIRDAIKECGRHILRLYKQFAESKRLKRIAGANGDVELIYFNASDISSDDLIFDNESELISSVSNRKNMVLELLKMGVLSDENGKMSRRSKLKILEVLGLGNWEAVRDIDDLHVKKASRENMNNGNELIASEIDDHELHILEHSRYCISEDANLDKNAIDRLVKHIRNHKQLQKMDTQARTINTEKQ